MDKLKDDIERYLSGKMTGAERHAFEKQALNDPFLADALEGAESLTAESFITDVSDLNKKISGGNNRQWLWPLRIAAAVVGIAVISTVVILFKKDDTGLLLSEQKPAKSEEKTIQQGDSIHQHQAKQSSSEDLVAVAEKKETVKNSKPNLTSSDKSKVEHTSTAKSNSNLATIARTDTLAIAGASENENVEPAVAFSLPSDQQPVSGNAVMQAEKVAFSGLTISGQVRDQQGQPLPGATVNIKGKVAGVATDADGKYSLTLQDTSATLQYAFIGFVPQEMKVGKSNDYVNVQLMEDATQLSEVVVTGYGEKRTDGEPVVRLAEPIGGRKAYDKYLEDAKRYPQLALENKVEGKVVIEFTVDDTGAISDFTVIKKLGFGCDEEVIRLVKEGPGWHPSYIDNEPVESLVRIKTRFELPGKK